MAEILLVACDWCSIFVLPTASRNYCTSLVPKHLPATVHLTLLSPFWDPLEGSASNWKLLLVHGCDFLFTLALLPGKFHDFCLLLQGILRPAKAKEWARHNPEVASGSSQEGSVAKHWARDHNPPYTGSQFTSRSWPTVWEMVLYNVPM